MAATQAGVFFGGRLLAWQDKWPTEQPLSSEFGSNTNGDKQLGFF